MTLWTFLTGRCDSLAPSGTALKPRVETNATAVRRRGVSSRSRPAQSQEQSPRRPATCEGSSRDPLGVAIHHAIAATFDRHRGPSRSQSRRPTEFPTMISAQRGNGGPPRAHLSPPRKLGTGTSPPSSEVIQCQNTLDAACDADAACNEPKCCAPWSTPSSHHKWRNSSSSTR